jgi:hypothetical protein
VTFDGLLGAPPEFARLVVPYHVGGVVVAVRAQRLSEPGIIAGVPGEACGGTAMFAFGRVAASVAGLGLAAAAGLVRAGVLADRAGVDRAEGRGGEGDEYCRVSGDVRGDAFAADQPGADDVVGIAAVGLGAAGARGGSPVSAGLVDRPVRHADRGDGAQQFAGYGVDVLDVAVQPDGAGACRGRPDVIEPGVVSGAVESGEYAFVAEHGVDVGSGVRPRARSRAGSGHESQHRAGSGHGQPPSARVLLVSVTGSGVSPQRCWAPWRVMPSRMAMSAQE